jgi:tetratricopeptide (TPR) repeat protein
VNFPGAIFFRRGEKGGGEKTVASVRAQAAPAPRRRRAGAPSGVAPSPGPAKPSHAVEAAPWARARALADRGSLDEALRLCQAALAADRLDAEGYQLLAAIQQERGEPAAAIEALRRALLEPDSPGCLGNLLVTRGRQDSNIQTAARMRQGVSHVTDAHRLAGGARAARGLSRAIESGSEPRQKAPDPGGAGASRQPSQEVIATARVRRLGLLRAGQRYSVPRQAQEVLQDRATHPGT